MLAVPLGVAQVDAVLEQLTVHRVGQVDPRGTAVRRVPHVWAPVVAAGGDQPLRRVRDRPHGQVAGGVAPVVHGQGIAGGLPGAPVGRAPDDRLALAAGIARVAAGNHAGVGGGDRQQLLAPGAGQRGRVDLLPGLAVGRVPDQPVLLVVDRARADRHEPGADGHDVAHRLLAAGVQGAAGTAVDARPGLAVGAEPQAGTYLSPHVLAAGHERAALAGDDVEGPLLVVAAQSLGLRQLPFAVGLLPDGGVGLGAVAHLADGDQACVSGGGRRHRLAGAACGGIDGRALPAAAVVGGPHRGLGRRRLGVEHRPHDRPRVALGRGGDQVGHVGHRILERQRAAVRTSERRGGVVGPGLGPARAGGGDQAEGHQRSERGSAFHDDRMSAAGLGVHGDPPVGGGRPPASVPVGCRFSPVRGGPVQSNRHVRRNEAPR